MAEDSLDMISLVFGYGIPALLVIFGYIAYFLSFSYDIVEIHDFGIALMAFGIIFFFVQMVAKELSEPEDNMAPLRAISNVFAYGVPALLITFGFIAYIRSVPTESSELNTLGLVLLIIGIIFYFIEMVARIARKFAD